MILALSKRKLLNQRAGGGLNGKLPVDGKRKVGKHLRLSGNIFLRI